MTYRDFVLGDRGLTAVNSYADWCAAYGELGRYRFIGASAIGKLHVREGRPREDAFAIRIAGPWVAVAVSDGVGSRPNSRYGASFVVEALCEHLVREAWGGASSAPLPFEHAPPCTNEGAGSIRKEDFTPISERGSIVLPLDLEVGEPWTPPDATECGTLLWYRFPLGGEGSPSEGSLSPTEEMVRRAFRNARRDLEQFVRSRDLTLSDVSCTLLGMMLNAETGAVAVGQIGDGLIAWWHPTRGAQPVVEALTPGEVGETYVLTQSDWEEYLAVRALPPEEPTDVRTFYLMTDGVADDCTYPPPEDIFTRWAQDIDREMRKEEPLPQKARRLLRWLATYEVKGSWDDRTLVVVWRIWPNH